MRAAGPAAVALLMLSAVLLGADALQMEAAAVRESGFSHATLDDRFVQVVSQRASAGDVVAVYPERLLTGPFASYDLLIVEAGEGEVIRNGSAASTVYAEVLGMDPDRCCRGPIHFTRPSVPGDPDTIDLVWVFHFDEGVERPAQGQERDYFDNWVRAAATAHGGGPGGGSVVTVQSWGVTTHRWLSSLGLASAGLGVVALGLWMWRDRAPAPSQASQAGLVDLAETGAEYLGRMAWLLAILLVPLLAAGWALEAFGTAFLADVTGPSAGWEERLLWGVRITWVAVAVAWAHQLWRVLHRLQVWKARPDIGL